VKEHKKKKKKRRRRRRSKRECVSQRKKVLPGVEQLEMCGDAPKR
jgi:hypothetical protein